MAQLIQLLNEAHISTKEHGDNVGAGFINITCPFCSDSRFHLGINLEEHWFKCLMCGEGGSWYRLAKTLQRLYPHVNWFSLGSIIEQPKYLDTYSVSPKVKKEISRLTRPLTANDIAVWEYLIQVRQLTPELIQEARITVGKGDLRGYITFVDHDFLVARKFTNRYGPDWKKHGIASVPYGATWVSRIKPLWVVIAEGVFDVLAVPLGHALGMFGITTSVKWLDIAMDFLPDTEIIIIGLDRGVSTRTIDKLVFMFSDCGYKVRVWDWSNPIFNGMKDLDDVRCHFGYAWLRQELLNLTGHGALKSDSLVNLL
jgi:hypothetical protein